MAQENHISLSIPDKEKNEIEESIKTLQVKLLKHLVTLSKDEIRELPKMGDKTVAFVNKASDYCESNPELVPAYIDPKELKIDLAAVDLLRSYINPLEQILESLYSSLTLSGSEAYIAALAFYQGIKAAAKSKVPGAQVIYDDLKQRFLGSGRPRKSE